MGEIRRVLEINVCAWDGVGRPVGGMGKRRSWRMAFGELWGFSLGVELFCYSDLLRFLLAVAWCIAT